MLPWAQAVLIVCAVALTAALVAAAQLGLGVPATELGETILGGHGSTVVVRAFKVNGVIEFRRVFRR